MVEDLVCPGASDSGNRALVAEERVQPTGLRGEELAEGVGAESECLRAQVRELFLRSLRRQQPDPRALLRARLREDELAAALEAQAEGRGLGAGLSRRHEPERPG